MPDQRYALSVRMGGECAIKRKGDGMKCTVCGGTRFVATEYKTGDRRAPALECSQCLAIVLEEGVARTNEERESVKIAIALRAAVRDMPPAPDQTDTFETERPVKPNAESEIGGKKS
jgi:hypothetical protein